MSDICLTSEIDVQLVQSVGGDHMVVAAAKQSTRGRDADRFADPALAEENYGLINYLVKNRHGSPFEHACLTFSIHAPAFVWWEWIRHRVGMTVDCPEFSFNLESGRYRQLEAVFWIPGRDRKLIPTADHKPSRPSFRVATEGEYAAIVAAMGKAYEAATTGYRSMIAAGCANEVSRAVLGFGVYYSGWVSCNPRSLMSFLSLRTHEPDATYVSRPQAEIEETARATERIFAEGWPLTYKAFCANGRVGP